MIHDCFHTALHGCVEQLFILSNSPNNNSSGQALVLFNKVLTTVCDYLNNADEALTNPMECNKVESVVGYLSCFFDSESVLHATEDSIAINELNEQVEAVVDCVIALQLAMKKHAGKHRELKSMYSDIRKGSIATMGAVFNGCPGWVAEHQSVFWEVSLKSLMTPVLFTSGYKALKDSDAFLTRMLQYLHSALLAVPRYSAAAADDIIQTIQDLIDGGSCYHLYAHATQFDILSALVTAYSFSPKPSPESNATDTKLNWQISIVVTMNALLHMCKKLEGTHILSREFYHEYLTVFINEFVTLTSEDASSSGVNKRKHSKAADLKVELLQSVTLLLMSLSESCNVPKDESVERLLLRLMSHLIAINRRSIVFEDDRVQVCTEVDLLVKIVVLLSSPAEDAVAAPSSVVNWHLILLAIMSLCNIICTRNGHDLDTDLTSCAIALTSSSDKGTSLVIELLDQLKCTYASSLSVSKVLTVECDIMYECVREAILTLTHHCTSLKPSEVTDKVLHDIYYSLPLEVNQLPALDASSLQQETVKLSVKRSFVYDILSNVKSLL